MKKAQSTLEYAIVIFAVIVALLGMQVYIRRSFQGKLRSSADQLSAQQYEPGNTVSDNTLTQDSDIDSDTTSTINNSDPTTTKIDTTTLTTINSQTETQTGTEKILSN